MKGTWDSPTEDSQPFSIQGNWNALTNTPDLTTVTQEGYAWIVSVAGTTELGGITNWALNDRAIKTLTGWAIEKPGTTNWGTVVGLLTEQTDLQNALNLKETKAVVALKQDKPATAVENNIAVFDANKDTKDSNISIVTEIGETPTDLHVPTEKAVDDKLDLKVNLNTLITSATHTKVTYDSKGLIIAGVDATTSDITDSTDKRYCTDAQKIIIDSVLTNNPGIEFDNSLENPAYAEGKLFYDKDKHALSYYNEQSDVTVNLGVENLIQVRNETGTTIPNGAVVYPTGFNNNEVLIGLALASDKVKCRLIGMATHTIENNTNGYVTKFGEVADINTSSYTSGDIVYLSETIPGGITKTAPTTVNYITRVGAVKVKDAVNGSIVVDTQTSEHTVEMLEDNGWSKTNAPTISFTDGILPTSRTLTLTPASVSFCFYQYGDKYCKATDSIQIPDEEGMFVIYYNLGTLTYIKNPTSAQVDILIRNNPLAAYVYWNATDKKAEYVGYELHKIGMDCTTHAYLHFAFGARYLRGLSPNTIVADGSGSNNASAQFGVDAGAITDEDIYFPTPTILSTTGLPIAYIVGPIASPSLRLGTNVGYSVLTTGTGRIAYNQLTGGSYQLTEVSNGDFVLYHIIAINENAVSRRVFAFMGQNQYTTVGNARAGAQTELATLRTLGILPQEVKAIATFIYETSNTYSNAVKSRIRTISTGVNFVDWRTTYLNGTNSGTSGGVGSTIFNDSLFQIIDNTEPTKTFQFEASSITAGQNRIITIPDANSTTLTGIAQSINGLKTFNNNINVSLSEYTDNASAVTAGLTVGTFYRTGDILKIVH